MHMPQWSKHHAYDSEDLAYKWGCYQSLRYSLICSNALHTSTARLFGAPSHWETSIWLPIFNSCFPINSLKRSYCWWFRNPAPVEAGSLSHYHIGFYTSQVIAGFLPSAVLPVQCSFLWFAGVPLWGLLSSVMIRSNPWMRRLVFFLKKEIPWQ